MSTAGLATQHTQGRPNAKAVGPDPRLDPIRAKVMRGERLSLADGDVLFTTTDIWTVCELADLVRRRLNGDVAFYNINRHLNYSNVCALSCKFCEFYRKQGDEGAYTRDLEYIRNETRKAVESGATEIHSVGGLHPYLPFSYYTDMIAAMRDTAASMGSGLHVKAFTAVEVVHLARIAKQYKGANAPGEEGRHARREGIRWVLSQLKEAGLGSLPGGGAEVFDDRVHDEAYKGKIRSDVWLDVHRVAHQVGLNTNATILYGHIEQRHDRLIHMDMLRRAQDEALTRLGYAGVAEEAGSDEGIELQGLEGRDGASGATARISSAAHNDDVADALARSEGGHLGYRHESTSPVVTLTRPGTPLPEHVVFGSAAPTRSLDPLIPRSLPASGYYQTIIPLPFFPDGSELEHLPGPTGLENLRTLAVSRLMLDNFPHVKAFWIMQTLPMAQLMLQNGADDIDGTVVWYDITKVAQGGSVESEGTHQEVTPWTLQKAIRDAGFQPVERDTVYRRVQRDGKAWRTL
ncbi:MAG: radical SAM protein [Pyrinomonadaceae bacterium]|nr:radical SAM protein [Phycisphaerales bacterium]